jgi:dATP/dGTP diphosphohydrolase
MIELGVAPEMVPTTILSGNAKDTNPKDAAGSRKARWFSYLPLRVLVGVGLALFEGARKYGRHNYRVAGVRASVYVDACVSGHLTPWMEGEDIDPDSGLSHIDKAIASLVVLRDGMYEGNWVDDRPPSAKDWPEIMADAHRRAAEIIDRYPDAVPAYTK